jgi:hypothetical protein
MRTSIEFLLPLKTLSKMQQRYKSLVSENRNQAKSVVKYLDALAKREDKRLMTNLRKNPPIVEIPRLDRNRQPVTLIMELESPAHRTRANAAMENIQEFEKRAASFRQTLVDKVKQQIFDRFPENEKDELFAAFDLRDVIMDERGQLDRELQSIDRLKFLFERRVVDLEDGGTITFEPFEGSPEEAKEIWKDLRPRLKSYAKDNLEVCPFAKLLEELKNEGKNSMIYSNGDEDDEKMPEEDGEEAGKDDGDELMKSEKKNQTEIWEDFFQKNLIELGCLRPIIELLIIMPSNTAELERDFNTVKSMKKGKRNQLADVRSRKIYTIMSHLKGHKVNWTTLIKIYNSLIWDESLNKFSS